MKSQRRRRVTRWVISVGGVVAVTAVLAGVKAGQIVTMVRAGEAMGPPPEAVASSPVAELTWQGAKSAIGSVVAVRGVTLAAELPGTVREITFESGGTVRRGQVLVRLDTSAEEAQLAAAEAEATLAALGRDRARALLAGEATAQADVDAAEAKAKAAAAAVANLRAVLAKKVIRAPFDGRVSIRQVELGQVLAPGAPVASLQSVSPIHVDFWLPQQALAEVREGQPVTLRTDGWPGATWTGRVTTVNPEVEVATRSVRVRATVPNADGRLRPGMFAQVELASGAPHEVLAIPATAVIYAPYGDSVFTVERGKDAAGKERAVARQKFVRVGEKRGDLVAVVSGLARGEAVVSAGAFKLRNGAALVVDDRHAPDAKAAPRPPEQ